MLNMKKGLAIVLAAATAFTFAPVANLGSTVEAEAATAEDTYDLSEAWGGSNFTVTGDVVTGGIKFDGITFKKNITVEDGHQYRVADENNIKVDSVSGLDPKTNISIVNSSPTTSNTKADGTTLEVQYTVKSVKGGSFALVDMTEGSHSYDQIKVKVTNNRNYDCTNTAFDPVIKNVTVTAGSNNTYGVAVGAEASHKNVGNNKQYTLQLNNGDSTYYAVTDVNATNYTSWTGQSGSYVTDTLKATSVSGGIKWLAPDAASGSLTTSLNPNDVTSKNVFSVTTANESENLIYVSFNAQSSDGKIVVPVQKTLRYVVDRSDNAVDWIKWNGTKLSVTNKTTDVFSYASQTLDPYINTTATILVKSETKDLTFISSDSTIASVQKDASKYYKATVTAHKAGTATISVYVGGTNNNKGKILTIPVSVAANAVDQINVKDAAGLYGAEEDDTIFLDAADSTASNAVKSVKLDITSKGGNAWDKFQSDDTSIATLSADGTLTAVAKNVPATSPKITHLTLVTKDNLPNHITAGRKNVTVVVWGKPAANFTVDDVYLNLSNASERSKTLETKPALSNVAFSVKANGNADDLDDDTIFTLTNNTSGNSQTTATVIGRAVGTGKIKALATETSTTRPTAKIVNVTVGADNANVITVDKDYLTLAEGASDKITAKATVGTVSFASADPSIATVSTGGAVTAVKAGTTKITVSAEGATSVVVPVVVAPKQATPDTATTPSKVTGVKVSNKKGGYVTVTWTKQDQKNIKYYVKKTVNGKSAGKSVNGGKTTLKVKKGATVKVKVKAYIYDATGKKLVGTYSKTVTKKTDKK